MVNDLREEIEAEIASVKHEIEKLKQLAKKRMGQPTYLDDVTHQLRELHGRLSKLEQNLRKA
jgi:septal ring factor EnvC (AmiA/AmiB activator)